MSDTRHDWTHGVYAITDAQLLPDDRRMLASCRSALEGGLALLQYRDKSGDLSHRLRQALALAMLCRDHAVPLIINDDLALVQRLRDAGFDDVGLHLGQEDGSLHEARRALGRESIIGANRHA
ncbi:MAG: thiamine phosphate synthase, partial [Halomonas sp.]|nr:thiamine phosphate synthase [Halomonas sp.]